MIGIVSLKYSIVQSTTLMHYATTRLEASLYINYLAYRVTVAAHRNTYDHSGCDQSVLFAFYITINVDAAEKYSTACIVSI